MGRGPGEFDQLIPVRQLERLASLWVDDVLGGDDDSVSPGRVPCLEVPRKPAGFDVLDKIVRLELAHRMDRKGHLLSLCNLFVRISNGPGILPVC